MPRRRPSPGLHQRPHHGRRRRIHRRPAGGAVTCRVATRRHVVPRSFALPPAPPGALPGTALPNSPPCRRHSQGLPSPTRIPAAGTPRECFSNPPTCPGHSQGLPRPPPGVGAGTPWKCSLQPRGLASALPGTALPNPRKWRGHSRGLRAPPRRPADGTPEECAGAEDHVGGWRRAPPSGPRCGPSRSPRCARWAPAAASVRHRPARCCERLRARRVSGA